MVISSNMAVREIQLLGSVILRRTARAVPDGDITSPRIRSLIADMIETAHQSTEGTFVTAGLAAPQVGESVRIVLVMQEGTNKKHPEYDIFINPEMEIKSNELVESEESCLSTPGLCGVVLRYKEIRLTYTDADGDRQRRVCSGDQAIYVQHECDHLDGVLWVDKVHDTKTFSYCAI